jgi:methanogenic corrinoid protein MtbC1
MANEQHSHVQEFLHRGWRSADASPLSGLKPGSNGRGLPPELVRMVEGEIVPRLLMMSQPQPIVPAQIDSPFSAEDVEELSRLLLSHDALLAGAWVELLRQNGASTAQICLHLLAPAARRLGALWDEDRCGFAEVTMGVCRLHQVLHWLTSYEAHPAQEDQGARNNAVLLSCMSGEQHTFGMLMVAQFMRRAGWDVANDFPADNEELLETARKIPFKIIGLSIGRESRVRDLTLLIKALRRASLNRSVAVMVGGPVLVLRPEIGLRIGADAIARDGQEAANWAQRYWQSITAPR